MLLVFTILFILGKSRLPEVVVRRWLICGMQKPQGEAATRMESWVQRGARMRRNLNHGSKLEDLVHGLLDERPQLRVSATQLNSRIGIPALKNNRFANWLLNSLFHLYLGRSTHTSMIYSALDEPDLFSQHWAPYQESYRSRE